MRKNHTDPILELSRKHALLRASDVRAAGLPSANLSILVRQGLLERVGRGVYQHPDVDWDENTSIATVAAMVPKGVIVLESALAFHGIGSHPARAVCLQLPMGATTPNISYPPVRIVRTRVEAALTDGVESHVLSGIAVRITNPARTVADCFKHRKTVGLELCLEALREVVPHRAKAAEVLLYAEMNQVERFMLPYLEMLA